MFQIVDEKSCRSWLSQQDRQTRIWFVTRIALRAFPTAIGSKPFGEQTCLRLLHHLLIATVGSVDFRSAKKTSWSAFGPIGYRGSAQQIHNDQIFVTNAFTRGEDILYGDGLPHAGAHRAEIAANVIFNAAQWAVEIRDFGQSAEIGGGYWELAWLVTRDFANKLATADALDPNSWSALWKSDGYPQVVSGDYSNLDDFFDADPEIWGFWRRWFKAIHDGNPMPWELTGMIATSLTNEDWQSGAAHVAQKISEIEALFAVKQSLADFEKNLDVVTPTDRHGIGGNYPPEDDVLPETELANYTVVKDAIDVVQKQTNTSQPDKSAVSHALEKLIAALGQCALWAGRKADLAVDTFIKVSITATGGYYVLDPSKLKNLIEAVKSWITYLP
jgi:hypothetical protein